MEITKENVAVLLVHYGVIPQERVDQLGGDAEFLATMTVLASLADIGKLLLDTDNPLWLLTFAISIFLMGPAEGEEACRMAGLIRVLGGTPDDVRAFIDKVAQKTAARHLADTAINKAATH